MEIVLNNKASIDSFMTEEIIYEAIILNDTISFKESLKNSIKVKSLYNLVIDSSEEINKIKQETYNKIKEIIKDNDYILLENGQVIEISVKEKDIKEVNLS